MTYQLRNDIPAPEARRSGRPASAKYPFVDMVVGQSFFEAVTAEEGKDIAEAQVAVIERLRAASNRWKKATGHTSRSFRVDVYKDNDGKHFVGCWRVA